MATDERTTAAAPVTVPHPPQTQHPQHPPLSGLVASAAPDIIATARRTAERADAADPVTPMIPEATVARLSVYLRVIDELLDGGEELISSEALARTTGVNSAKLRKDLSFLGSFGTRGVGYDLPTLRARIADVLGITSTRGIVIVGVGNLGHALAGYAGFGSRGFHVAGLFDADRLRVGERIGDQYVQPMSALAAVVAAGDVAIGIIATPAAGAQRVADALVDAGVTSILNFAPVVLAVPVGVQVRKVDLASELQILSFHARRREAREARAGEAR